MITEHGQIRVFAPGELDKFESEVIRYEKLVERKTIAGAKLRNEEGKTAPPTDKITPPTDKTVPPTDKTVPPTDKIIPPTDKTMPPTTDKTVPLTTDIRSPTIGKKRQAMAVPQEYRNKTLPSSFMRRQARLESQGLIGTRQEDAKAAKGTLSSGKVRPEWERNVSVVEQIMIGMGIKKKKPRVTSSSLVGPAGRPIKSFDNEFTRLRDKVNKMDDVQKGVTKLLGSVGTVSGLVSGASSLTSLGGSISLVTSMASRLPYVAVVVSVATTVVRAYLRMYEAGGPRDRRKLVLAEDYSLIGVENENYVRNAHIMFFSNPSHLQGLPQGKSNTRNLEAGVARYLQRHQGDGMYGR